MLEKLINKKIQFSDTDYGIYISIKSSANKDYIIKNVGEDMVEVCDCNRSSPNNTEYYAIDYIRRIEKF